MIRLIVVDDEVWIRERIAKEVPWETIGVEVVGTAEDGEEALEMIRERQPDVVITDIRMPEIDGIELLKQAREISEDMKVILLSGYNDFTYAKSALSYGAFDYVLKPVEDEDLMQVVERAVRKLEEERQHVQNYQSLQEKATLAGQVLKEKILLDLLYGDYYDGKEASRGEYFNAETLFPEAVKKDRHRCVLVMINNLVSEPERRRNDLYRIDAAFCAVLEKYGETARAYNGNRKAWVYILSYDRGTEDIERNLLDDLKKAQDSFQKDGLSLSVGVGEATDDFYSISYAYQTVKSLMKYRSWTGNDRIIYDSSNLVMEMKEAGGYQTDRLASLLRKGDYEGAEKELTDIYRMVKEHIPSGQLSAACRLISIDVENEFYQFFKHTTGKDNAHLFRIEFWNAVDEIRDESQMLDLIRRFHKEKKENRNKSRKIAMRAEEYIYSNYDKAISLNDVASSLDLNPSYLCRVFREEEGISLVTFLRNYRMEKAASLLRETEYKISEISTMVGYENQQYFNKVFKAEKGISPTGYREKVRESG